MYYCTNMYICSQQYIAEDAVSLHKATDVLLPAEVFGEVGGF